jgi:NADH dehydrogenase
MILVTGGLGFISRGLIKGLTREGYPVRVLLETARQSPPLPKGVAVDVVLSSLLDERGVRAALLDIDTVIHVGAVEYSNSSVGNPVQGAYTLMEKAAEAGVDRFLLLSHLGSSLTSAYHDLRENALLEHHLRAQNISHTIIRPGVVYGPGDYFTCPLAMMMALIPVIFPIPGQGDVLIHPLWIQDLTMAVAWSLSDPDAMEGTYEIGGPEFFSFREVVEMIMKAAGMRRLILPVRQPYIRALTWMFERAQKRPLFSTFWVDYLAANRTAELQSMPRDFGLQPARMKEKIAYLNDKHWLRESLRYQFR